MEPRQHNPNCTAERQQVPELASASKPKRRFRINRLEERITPGKPSFGCAVCTPIYKWGDHGNIIGWNCSGSC